MNVVALVPVEDGDSPHSDVALVRVRGEPALTHAVRGLLQSGSVDQVIVTSSAQRSTACSAALEPFGDGTTYVPDSGAGRLRSALETSTVRNAEIILIHDAARPFTPVSVIDAVVEALHAGAPVAVPVLPVTDTIKAVGPHADGLVVGTHDRTNLRSVQAPVGCRADVLAAIDPADPTDLLGHHDVRTVPGHALGMRLGTPFDRTVAEALLAEESA